jgi:lysophospholipase L1-like esterase
VTRRAKVGGVKTSWSAWWLVGACAAGQAASACQSPKPLQGVHLVGRFEVSDPAGPRYSFAGSRVVTRFVGAELRVRLVEPGPVLYSVRVDGHEQPVLKTQPGSRVYTLATGLAAGAHDLVLTRRTEAFVGISQIAGFDGATVEATPAPYHRFIEIVGDPISNGYGVLGDSPACGFSVDTESEPDAYGALAAETLHAGHATIAYSGKGIFENYGGADEPLMDEVYERTFGDQAGTPWAGSGYRPDVVVVNLGTNDFWRGDPGEGFSAAYDAFLRSLRRRHAEAWIVVVLSPMLSDPARGQARTRVVALVDAAKARGDRRMDFLEFDEQRAEDGLGCDYHPGRVTQQKMAAQLVAKLRALTGWKE